MQGMALYNEIQLRPGTKDASLGISRVKDKMCLGWNSQGQGCLDTRSLMVYNTKVRDRSPGWHAH